MTVRKGDAVVVEKAHSSTAINMKTTRYSTYHIAQAVKVVGGRVTEFKLPNGKTHVVFGNYRVLTIEDEMHQEGAKRLYSRVKPEENDWPDKETMKKAIVEAFQWDRVL